MRWALLLLVGLVAIVGFLRCEGDPPSGTAQVVTIRGKTIDAADVPQPIVARPTVKVRGRMVRFGCALTTGDGRKIRYIRSGRRVLEPKVIVQTPDGEEVYKCSLEYG
jgi:hypothetical protein